MQVRAVGSCQECFGLPHGTVMIVDLDRAPQIDDFALIEMPETHEVTGLRRQVKRLGMRMESPRADRAPQEVVTLESVCQPVPLESTDLLLGTVVAALVPQDPQLDELGQAMDRHLDDFIREANRISGRSWKRRPAVSL